VYGLLHSHGRLLLMRRAGSGYRDGTLALPAGHLDGGEDALSALVRELHEEIGVAADPASCRLATVVHSGPEDADDEEYVNFFFTVGGWTGTPRIGEPDKCTELVWVDPDRLPADAIDYLPAVLAGIAAGEPLLLTDWPGRPSRSRP
jgi:8-oxo-dGTP pyrophosphatase MutT (NUDIX family)